MIDPRELRSNLSRKMVEAAVSATTAARNVGAGGKLVGMKEDMARDIEALTHHRGWKHIEDWLLQRANPLAAIEDDEAFSRDRLFYARCAIDLLAMVDVATKVTRLLDRANANE